MIYDRIDHMAAYRGMAPGLDRAIDFVQHTDLASLPLGRVDIDGENVFANVMEATARDASELHYELHRRYMDIQIDIEGTEAIFVGRAPVTSREAFSEERDFQSVDAAEGARLVMGPGYFAALLPGEPHLPSAAAVPERHLRKIVIKVALPCAGR